MTKSGCNEAGCLEFGISKTLVELFLRSSIRDTRKRGVGSGWLKKVTKYIYIYMSSSSFEWISKERSTLIP